MRFTTVKRTRLERGLLQIDVAATCRIYPSRLSQIETGRVAPRPDELERIATALGVTVDELRDEPATGAAA